LGRKKEKGGRGGNSRYRRRRGHEQTKAENEHVWLMSFFIHRRREEVGEDGVTATSKRHRVCLRHESSKGPRAGKGEVGFKLLSLVVRAA